MYLIAGSEFSFILFLIKKTILNISQMKRLLTVALLIAAISSCKKNTNSVTPNTSYSPVTVGSTWTYLRNSSDGKFNDSVYIFTATSGDTTIGNKVYNVFNNSTGGNIYYAITDSGYYRTGSLLSGLGIPQLASFQELYLVNKPTTASTWSTSLQITLLNNPLTITINYSIPSIGDTLTVLGNLYNNVIHVQLNSDQILEKTPVSGDFYYAQGIGLISFNVTAIDPNTLNPITTTFNLKSSSIK